MNTLLFTFVSALVYPLINCADDTTMTGNITDAEGESCYAQLELLADENCSTVKKFLVGAPSVSWFQAKVNCEIIGQKLASIESKEENENIMKQLKKQGLDAPLAWIGYNDLAKEGTFQWASNVNLGSPYSNWYLGEPNSANDDEDCVSLYPDGSFNDYNCNANMHYVCEYTEHCSTASC